MLYHIEFPGSIQSWSGNETEPNGGPSLSLSCIAHRAVGEAGRELVAVLVPADLVYPTGAFVLPDQCAVLHTD